MKLLLDEQISGRVAQRLREKGIDARAVVEEPALRGLSDELLFDAAQADGRTVVTYNRSDFEPIARAYAAHAGAHGGLVIVHPTKLDSWQISRLADRLEHLAENFEPYPGFVTWLS